MGGIPSARARWLSRRSPSSCSWQSLLVYGGLVMIGISAILTSLIALGIWFGLYSRELNVTICKRSHLVRDSWKTAVCCRLVCSFLGYRKGVLAWKGREYPVGTSGASKK